MTGVILPAILLIAIIGSMIAITAWLVNRKTKNAWLFRKYADDRGLCYYTTAYSTLTLKHLHGIAGGCRMTIDEEMLSSGNSCRLVTRLELTTQIPTDFEIAPETVLTRIEKAFGLEEVTIGHEHVDRLFLLRSHQPAQLMKLMALPEIADHMVRLAPHLKSCISNSDGVITYRVNAAMLSEQDFIDMDCVIGFLLALNNAARTPDGESALDRSPG